MRKYIDLIGQTFGYLIVTQLLPERDKWGQRLWLCACKCGKDKIASTNKLRSGELKSCGCFHKEQASIANSVDLTGKRFDRLIVIEKLGRINSTPYIYWKCLCNCGKVIQVITASLINGNTKSCGCIRLERIEQWVGPNHPNWNHDLSPERRKYDKQYRRRDIKEFKIWSQEIKKLANYTCQKCKKTNCKLESHHIKSWIEYPEDRYKLENGICFCKGCHKEFHKLYKYKNNADKIDVFLKELK